MAYFSNSTSGSILDEQCGECMVPHDAPCPVLFCQTTYNYSQVSKPDQKTVLDNLVDDEGICKMKKVLDDIPSHHGDIDHRCRYCGSTQIVEQHWQNNEHHRSFKCFTCHKEWMEY